jgi:hypothetical protein
MTPCFACGLVMSAAELFVAVSHVGLLPGRAAERMTFHAACARRAPPRASTWTVCAMCGGSIDARLARETARWLVSRAKGVDRERTVAVAPAGVRFVDPGAEFLGGRLPALTALVNDPLLDGEEAVLERVVRPYFELCHAECVRR